MSDIERAEARAEGALKNFIDSMKQEMIQKDRSPEYEAQFWFALENLLRTGI